MEEREGVGRSGLGEELEAGAHSSLPDLTIPLYCAELYHCFKELEHQSEATDKGPRLT